MDIFEDKEFSTKVHLNEKQETEGGDLKIEGNMWTNQQFDTYLT